VAMSPLLAGAPEKARSRRVASVSERPRRDSRGNKRGLR
jgi:hypothetical protein